MHLPMSTLNFDIRSGRVGSSRLAGGGGAFAVITYRAGEK